MERSKHESVASLLEDHPLPWTVFPGSIRPGESWIADSNGRSVVGIRTSIANHEAVLELLRHILPDKMPELASSESTGNAVLDQLMQTYGASSAEQAARQKWLEGQGVRQHKPGFPGPRPELPV